MPDIINTHSFVFSFQEIDNTNLMLVGGKAANLAALSTIEGIQVPAGFCISTEAFKKMMAGSPLIEKLITRLSRLRINDRDKIAEYSSEIRKEIESSVIPAEIQDQISHHLSHLGEKNACAVRSSATAEDLPTASFAGQQDSYLNIIGEKAILQHISQCWASLFTERAVIYRIQNGFDHRKVYLSVIVQKMVFPHAAGILFTADPISGNRKALSIDAGFGLGEAMVSGLVNVDNYKVICNEIINKKIPAKKLAVYPAKNGGTQQQEIAADQQHKQVLTDNQVLQLEHIGRKIENHFGSPQDIEWCLSDDEFYIVQSRPITTLYPVPSRSSEARAGAGADDFENHVYVSVGHQQMMTDAMKPLGLSLWQLTAGRPMYQAGGRLFVDITAELATPAKREIIINVLGKSDPLIRDALTTIVERKDFIKTLPDDHAKNGKAAPLPNFQALQDYDPAVVTDLIQRSQTQIAELKQTIQTRSGTALLDFILENMQQRQQSANPQSFEVIMTGMNAAAWINEKMFEWLGEKNAADSLSQSVPNNVTSEMGLLLLDVADVIRPYPEVIAYLQQTKNDNFLDDLLSLKGGKETRDAMVTFLNKYGMRCAGEIDVTKPRWSEKPAILIPMLLNNIKNVAPGESKRKFEQGRQEAIKKEKELLERLAQLPDGEQKVQGTKRMIGLIRNFSGYREYPKYDIVSRYFVYKQALLKEAAQLVQANVIREKEDIYYLNFQELGEAMRTHTLDYQLINQRKEAFRLYERLTPPRIITSDGEIITGKYKRENLPANAIAALAVSSGIIEGRARVVLNLQDANIEEGDILVTAFTDPSWTPLFVSVKGLVTEVGGLMTHGAVIAREYGLPAVVGVENATKLIKDGQRIRVNGTDGYVELL
ncbi:MAG: phosphoenolpyruvate synthase [Agriterribacter sp.]